MRSILLLLVLGACSTSQESPTSLSGGVTISAPPPRLLFAPAVGGERTLVLVRNLEPGTWVSLAGSLAGPGVGPCPPVLEGACLDLLAPVRLAEVEASPQGDALLVLDVPATLAGETLSVQAAAFGRRGVALTAVASRVVGQGPVADSDGDGLNDQLEAFLGTSPTNPDTDSDRLRDGEEVFVHGTSPVDFDTDGDNVPDGLEVQLFGTFPLDPDSDQDGLEDGDELLIYGTDPANPDTDGDGLLDGDEVLYGADPLSQDTDGDGLSDRLEVDIGSSPFRTDTDYDGLDDSIEYQIGSDPTLVDTDGDGLGDLEELLQGTDWTNPDSDGDRVPDGAEIHLWHTDPLRADTDRDGVDDGDELDASTDPLRPPILDDTFLPADTYDTGWVVDSAWSGDTEPVVDTSWDTDVVDTDVVDTGWWGDTDVPFIDTYDIDTAWTDTSAPSDTYVPVDTYVGWDTTGGPTDTSACFADVLSVAPADGETDVWLGTDIVVRMPRYSSGTPVLLDLTDGSVVPTIRRTFYTTTMRVERLDPTLPLDAMTAYGVLVQATCGVQHFYSTFTTQGAPAPVAPILLEDSTWAVDLSVGELTWPLGIVGLLQPLLQDQDVDVLITLGGYNPTTARFPVGWNLGEFGIQDTCFPTRTTAPASYSNPDISFVGVPTFPRGTTTSDVFVSVEGTVSPGADYIDNARIYYAMPFDIDVGLDLGGGSLCDLMLTFGVECEPCPHRAGECAIFVLEGSRLERVADAVTIPDPPPQCAQASECGGCQHGTPGRFALLAGLLGLALRRRR